ncbi:MAG: YihY/virulence factor BrkB family protein [Clostridia bacterium]|nr:YihY/virulence factor BrkB family protein [Clostridia bacterium]
MLKILRKHIYGFIRKMSRDRCDALAAQVAFFIFTSFVPLMMFLLSILQTIEIDGMSLLTGLISKLPVTASGFLLSVFREERQTFALLSVTAISTLWSASMAMFALIKGMNDIFLSRLNNRYWKARGLSLVYTFLFLLAIAISIFAFVFGNTFVDGIRPNHPELARIFDKLMTGIGFLAIFIFFVFSFKIIPIKAKVKMRNAALGALVSTLGWWMFSFFFSIFVENFSNYASVYGSLAAIIVLMVWLYFCMYIMFISGEIVAWLQISSLKRDVSEYILKKKTEKEKIRKQKQEEKRKSRILRKHEKNPEKFPLPENFDEDFEEEQADETPDVPVPRSTPVSRTEIPEKYI